jgi:cellulose synthase/poly-beta-1,6-N-acetylglucosamine synthase-like glycosyltransferase
MKSCGEIIAFTDSDAVPDSDWLAKIVHLHQTIDTDGVGGCVVNGYPKSLMAWVIHLTEFTEWLEQSPSGFVNNVPSVNISFKRETFRKYGICYSDFFPSEDTLFNWSLHTRGGKLYFDPSVRLTHMSRIGIGKVWRHQRRLGKASAHARRISTLPGQIFVCYPALALFLPALRLARAGLRFLTMDLKLFAGFLLISPLYLFALTAWTSGFMCKASFYPPKYKIEGCTFDQFG